MNNYFMLMCAGEMNSEIVVLVVIPVAISLVVITIICGCFLWRRIRSKRVGKSYYISYRIQSSCYI
jgi:hypothetical protein